MDKDAEKVCKVSHGCQVTSGYDPLEPMSRVLPPTAPWQDCSADLLGPLPSGESILVVVDYFSRFLEVAILKSTTSAKIIEAISPMFARFGVPFSLRTDNGPQFVSEEFETFLRSHGVEHRRTTPLWPQANGEVERQNRSLLKCLRIAHLEKKNLRTELVTWLTAYRSTPQVTTGATPFSLMFGREMRSKLPELRRETVDVSREETRDKDWSSKTYADDKRGAVPKSIRVGDAVLLKAEKSNKLSSNFHPSPFKVVQKTGSEVTVRNDVGVEFKRNTAFVKKYNVPEGSSASVTSDGGCSADREGDGQEPGPAETADREGDSQDPEPAERDNGRDEGQNGPKLPEPEVRPSVVRRSTRQVQRPSRFNDFVLSLRN